MASKTEREKHQAFFVMLCKAAGVDHLKVRSIECRAGFSDVVTFTVDTMGEGRNITKVLETESGNGTE